MSSNAASAANARSALGSEFSFSHIYVEEGAYGYQDARELLTRFPDAVRVPIQDYKEVFSRPNQSFQLQKSDNKLILAVKKGNFLYEGSERINSFGDRRLHYNSLIRNCLYNCDYCFLQGMHPSAYIVVFVNSGDFFTATDRELASGPLYVSISYLTDLLGFESLIPNTRRWIEFAAERPELTIEVRTKSDNYRAIRDLSPIPNAILSWTMSPEAVVARYERGTASFKNRLLAVRSAVEDGWRVRLCFDPLLRVARWQEEYGACIEEIFRRVAPARIEEYSVGVLRMSGSHLKQMRIGGAHTDLIYHPLEVVKGTATYPPVIEEEMREAIAKKIAKYADPGRISFVGG